MTANTIPLLKANPVEIARALGVFCAEDQIIEIRALGVSTPDYKQEHTSSGYFDDQDKAAKTAAQIDSYAHGIYFTINPCKPELLSRRYNRVKTCGKKDQTTADHNIDRRRWLPIDADPVRVSGVSSNDIEHKAAISRAYQIRDWLESLGWQGIVLADSGNGAHALAPIDLPNDPESTILVQQCLEALASKFNDSVVTIDTSNHNASRIWKLPGTVARKGDNTPERPHRQARLLDLPDLRQPNSRELLLTLAAMRPRQKEAPKQHNRNGHSGDSQKWLDEWIAAHATDAEGPEEWHSQSGKGRRWIFPVCPWDTDHTNRSAFITQQGDGPIAAGCHHNGCQGKAWEDLRRVREPGYGEKKDKTSSNGYYNDPDAPEEAWEMVQAAITQARETKDVGLPFQMANLLAKLPAENYARAKASFKEALEDKLNLNDFEKAVNEARRKAKTEAQIRAKAQAPAGGGAWLPSICIQDRPLRDISDETVDALESNNTPAVLFARGGSIARTRTDENSRPVIDEVKEPELRGRMTRTANFIKYNDQGTEIQVSPPMDVVSDVLALGKWPFPALEAITEIPVLRPDGTILDTPGYDPATRLIYAPDPQITIPPIPANPTPEEAREAMKLITDELLGDFPFAEPSSKANCVALVLSPILRQATRRSPLALVDAPQQGTGKSLIAESVATIATGRPAAMMSQPRDDEEWRKQITSTLLDGSTIITIDNIEGTLYAPSLARVLTADRWQDRILGQSKNAILPQRATWIGTGNNIQLGGDLPRRCYPIRLDAKVDKPWQRTEFKHPDLIEWIIEHRGELLAALLTIARAWYVAGKPRDPTTPVVGSFNTWASSMGGILQLAGVSGFLGNLDRVYELANEEATQWENFLSEWALHYGQNAVVTVAQIAQDVREERKNDKGIILGYKNEDLRNSLPDEMAGALVNKEVSFERRLGRALKRKVEVRHGPHRIFVVAGKIKHQAKTWTVVVGDGGEGEFGSFREFLSSQRAATPPTPLHAKNKGEGWGGVQDEMALGNSQNSQNSQLQIPESDILPPAPDDDLDDNLAALSGWSKSTNPYGRDE